MADFFISHSSNDNAAAARVSTGLRDNGLESLFVDFDPEQGIPPGRDWEREIYAQINSAAALIALCSQASVISRWCFAEIALAKQLGKTIFPVLLQQDSRHPLLGNYEDVNPARDGDAAYDQLFSKLKEMYQYSFEYDSRRSPYPGMSAFDEADAAVFFGRRKAIADLLEVLERQPRTDRGIGVVGPSGSGKSSLVHAGLLPMLKKPDRRHQWVFVPSMVPGENPVENLARSLAFAFGKRGLRRGYEDLMSSLGGGPEALVRCAKDLRDESPGRPASVLLVIDQAEELVTLHRPAERTAFLDLIRGALDVRDTPLWAVITMRSEFLSASPSQAGVARLIDKSVVLETLDRSRLADVIAGPARKAGLYFDPGLVERMALDTVGGDALPALAYALRQLSERSRGRPDRLISEEDYDAIGGVGGAIRAQADAVADGLRHKDLGALVLSTLMRLAMVDGDNEPTRRRVRRGALSQAENQVVQEFIDARLLVSYLGDDGAAVVEVAHEALLRQWPPLREAIEADREELRIRAELERQAQDWDRAGRRYSYLIGGERLETAQRWAAGQGDGAGELSLVLEFLDQSSRSDQAALLRASEAVARRALASVDRDPELCLLLALAAIEDYAPTSLAHQALLAALATPAVYAVLRGHDDAIWGLAWSPDGKRLATVSDDRDVTIRVWNTDGGEELMVLRGHEKGVIGVAWSPDGRRLATASRDKTVRLWDAATGAQLAVLHGHRDAVWGVAWSPDGRWLATAAGENVDHSPRIWDAERGELALVLDGHEDWVEGVAWSPDGRRLATASGDQTVRVWDAVTGAELAVLRGHERGARGVTWSPDGRRLASVSYDKTLRVWDAERGAALAVLDEHEDVVRAVAWSPDGARLATGSHDHTARIWDLDGPTEVVILRHQDAVRSLAWSPDGKRLATGTHEHDRTARIWDTDRGIELAVLRGHRGDVNGVAWSADGSRLVTGCSDRLGRIWEAAGGRSAILPGHEQPVMGVAWSPDGRQLASASADGTVRLWDATGATETTVLSGHRNEVRSVAWSPDGTRLASGSYDKTARIWDPSTGGEFAVLGDPQGHAHGHDDWVEAVAWSPDGRRLASASYDRTVRIWDARTKTETAVLAGHKDRVLTVAWSPDGRRLASASQDRTVRIWDTATNTQLAEWNGHEGPVLAVAWSPDGQWLASVGEDRTARIWLPADDPDPAREMRRAVVVGVHEDAVLAVAWSPDGRRLATASRDRTARVWDAVTYLDTRALVAKAGARVFRGLTEGEQMLLPAQSRRRADPE